MTKDVKVRALSIVLSNRDANLTEIGTGKYTTRPLSEYLRHAETRIERTSGTYSSKQGATLTPQPFWCIELETVRRKVGQVAQVQAKQTSGQFHGTTARWAKVAGTGSQKAKWREGRISGPIALGGVLAVVSSSWLVPYSIAHRYLCHLPVSVVGRGRSAAIKVHVRASTRASGLDAWGERVDPETEAMRSWTKKAQRLWDGAKTERSFSNVADRINYQGTLANQPLRAIRVVYPRSRTLYASVLDPEAKTALGLPLRELVTKVREGDKVISTSMHKLGGVIAENLLHWVEVEDIAEAHWLAGVFNARVFIERVLERAGGKEKGSQYVPGIYNIPVDLLAEYGVAYDPKDAIHSKISRISRRLQTEMGRVVKNYIEVEKGVNTRLLDDTNESPIVPDTISSALLRRLMAVAPAELAKNEHLVRSLLPS